MVDKKKWSELHLQTEPVPHILCCGKNRYNPHPQRERVGRVWLKHTLAGIGLSVDTSGRSQHTSVLSLGDTDADSLTITASADEFHEVTGFVILRHITENQLLRHGDDQEEHNLHQRGWDERRRFLLGGAREWGWGERQDPLLAGRWKLVEGDAWSASCSSQFQVRPEYITDRLLSRDWLETKWGGGGGGDW